MSKNSLKIIKIILVIIFAVSTGMVISNYVQSKNAEQSYEDAKDIAQTVPKDEKEQEETDEPEQNPEDEPISEEVDEVPVYINTTKLEDLNLEALREINADVVGWIRIPGTVVDYPVLKGADNDYYLDHTWNNKKSAAGAIFIEHYSSADFSDFNTIIYGHHMNNNAMFGSLLKYKQQSYFDNNPYVYILDDNGIKCYEIFSAYEADVKGKTYQVSFSSDESKQEFLDECMANSVIETGITPDVSDRIITLSTCTNFTYNTRWVVQARIALAE